MSSTTVTLTPSGNASLKPRQGRSWKRARRIDIVARMEAAFVQDADIARHLDLTVAAIQAIKRSPEFMAKRHALATGVLSMYDRVRLDSEAAQKDELEELIPDALNAVRTVLSDRTHPQYSRVAMDILDRNKHTSKISRTQHSVAPPPDTTLHDAQAAELLSLLGPGEIGPLTIEASSIGAPQPVPALGISEEDATIMLETMEASGLADEV